MVLAVYSNLRTFYGDDKDRVRPGQGRGRERGRHQVGISNKTDPRRDADSCCGGTAIPPLREGDWSGTPSRSSS